MALLVKKFGGTSVGDIKKIKNISQEYLMNLLSNLLDIESLLKQGNNPINVFIENLINLS